DGAALNHHDAVPDHVTGFVGVLQVLPIHNLHIAADAAILVQDSTLDPRMIANAQRRDALRTTRLTLGFGFVHVGADHDCVAQHHVASNAAAHADDAVMQLRAGEDHAAVGDQAILHAAGSNMRRGQVPAAGVD